MIKDETGKGYINENTITEKINNLYMEYSKNPVIYKNISKAYIAFVLEDTRGR